MLGSQGRLSPSSTCTTEFVHRANNLILVLGPLPRPPPSAPSAWLSRAQSDAPLVRATPTLTYLRPSSQSSPSSPSFFLSSLSSLSSSTPHPPHIQAAREKKAAEQSTKSEEAAKAAARAAAARAKAEASSQSAAEQTQKAEAQRAAAAAAEAQKSAAANAMSEAKRAAAEQVEKNVERKRVAQAKAKAKKSAANEHLKKKEAEGKKKKVIEEQKKAGEQEAEDVRAASQQGEQQKKAEMMKKQEEAMKEKTKSKFAYFTVTFTQRGPLGLWFDPSGVPPTIAAPVGKIKKGDQLVSVNDEVVVEMNPEATVMTLAEADSPRTLRFRRPKAVSATTDAQDAHKAAVNLETEFEIFSPLIAAGTYRFQQAEFGLSQLPCEPIDLRPAQPMDGCNSVSGGYEGSIMVVSRGTCSFIIKAEKVQAVKGSMVLITNTEEKLMKMPKGAARVKHIEIGMSLVAKKIGFMIGVVSKMMRRNLMADGRPGAILASFGQGKRCESERRKARAVAQSAETGAIEVIQGTRARKAGHILLWDGKKYATYEAEKGTFGTAPNNVPYRLVIGKPIQGCEPFHNSDVAGALVVVQRGACPFFDKAMQVQKQAGAGVLILNTEEKMLKLSSPPEGDKITIPVIAAGNAALQTMIDLTTASTVLIKMKFPETKTP